MIEYVKIITSLNDIPVELWDKMKSEYPTLTISDWVELSRDFKSVEVA